MVIQKKKIIKYVVFLFALLPVGNVLGENINVRATMDSTSILIGHQTRIFLELTQDNNKSVQFPLLQDTIVKGIEIIKISKPDTLKLSDSRIQINQEVLITSFDSGLYYIPPFKYVDGIDTSRTNSLGLKVISFPVDTVSKEFFDIKTVMKPPFVWRDYFWPIMLVLIAIFLIVSGIYIYQRWKKRKENPQAVSNEPLLPPHIKALNKLEYIKQEKLWQNGREKEYYTELTDALRIYIEERYQINAMEMTSSEILSVIRVYNDAFSVYGNLKQILETADFVKFAKMRPIADDNELSMMNALFFVNQTKEDDPVETEEKTTQQSEEQK